MIPIDAPPLNPPPATIAALPPGLDALLFFLRLPVPRSIEALTWAAMHHDSAVRRAVAQHPQVTAPLLQQLVQDKDRAVWKPVIHHKDLPPEAIIYLLTQACCDKKRELARRKHLEPWVMGVLACAVGYVARELTRRKDLPLNLKLLLARRVETRDALMRCAIRLEPEVEAVLASDDENFVGLLNRKWLRGQTLMTIATGARRWPAMVAAELLLDRAAEVGVTLCRQDLESMLTSTIPEVRRAGIALSAFLPTAKSASAIG